MRRRAIVKEFTDGKFKDTQKRAGLGQPQRSGQHRQHEADLQQGLEIHRRRYAYVRQRESQVRDAVGCPQQVFPLEVKREEQRPIWSVLKGECRYCGKHIGRGIAGHERHCATTHPDR